MGRFPELERAVLERDGRRSGDEIWFRCPFPENHKNGDARPSAKFNYEKGVWCCTVCKKGGGAKQLSELLGVAWRPAGEIAATYPYTDADGQLLFEVVRLANPKDFRQRRPDGKGGWIWSIKGVRRVLYRLPEIRAAVEAGKTIHIVEGEKDADNLVRLGLAATTNPGGAGKWNKAYSETLRGARVAILPDNDPPGRDHAQRVAERLHGIAAEVRIVLLPDLLVGGDVSDWIANRSGSGRSSEDICAELAVMAAEAPLWQPGTDEAEDAEDASSAPPPAEQANDAIKALWALGSDPDPAAVAATLQPIAAALAGADQLTVQTTRTLALRALRGKVPAPAKMVDAALASAAGAVKAAPLVHLTQVPADSPYRATDAGLVYLKPTKEGEIPVLLTNFTARIVAEIARDDGVEVQRSFEIEAHHGDLVRRFEVSASRYSSMWWVAEHLGATAVLSAGSGTRDHARAAIQLLSDEVQVRTVYTHLGWRRIGGQWCYLHAGGAIGTVGTVPDVETDIPQQLRRYHLPELVDEAELVCSVRASLRILDLLPDRVTVPVFCAPWRAVLGACDHSLHVAGLTGEGKTELAALPQQHFGRQLDARHLPGSWISTGNSLEALASAAKDALLVVDDFAPEGGPQDVQRLHREASRLLRAQGNRSGRDRLRPDGELRPPRAPSGLVLSTGEDVPGGKSIRARLFCLDVPAGAMDWDLLTLCQADAAAGLYAQAMTGFLMWVAERYDGLEELRPQRISELRAQATASTDLHRRTPGIVADLAFGLEIFLRFARDVGAVDEQEAQALWERGWAALGAAAAAQAEHVASMDPARRFLELLGSAIASGRAHVASDAGSEPTNPGAWGWRQRTPNREGWEAQGARIGWLSGGELYLDPDAAFKAAQGAATLDGLSVSPRTLWKRLKEAGLLASSDDARKRNTVRVSLQGVRREVLHLRPETLLPAEPSQPSQPSQGRRKPPPPGTVRWDGSGAGDGEPSQETVPRPPLDTALPDAAGTVGTVGTVPETTDLDGFEDP